MSDYAASERPLTLVHRSQGSLWTDFEVVTSADAQLSTEHPLPYYQVLSQSQKNTGASPSVRLRATEIVRAWWEAQKPRPIQKFVVVRQVVERALEAGWSPELIREAMDNVPTISARWLEGYVNRHRRGRSDGLEAVRRHLASSDDRQELSE